MSGVARSADGSDKDRTRILSELGRSQLGRIQMSPIRLGFRFAITIALWILVVASPAFAKPSQNRAQSSAYGVVTIDLRPEQGSVPTHLCVVSELSGPRTREQLAELLKQSHELVDGDWVLNPSAWQSRADDAQNCEYGGQCVPRIRLPRGIAQAEALHMACTTDSLLGAAESIRNNRLLVLMLEHLEGSPPVIGALKLTGGIVTVGVHLDLDQVVVTARSLGGSYVADERSFRAESNGQENKLIVMPITPQCEWISAELAGARLTESDRDRMRLSFDGHLAGGHACIGELLGNSLVRVYVPRAGVVGHLEIALSPRQKKRILPVQRYAGRWRGPWPRDVIKLAPMQLSFMWRRPDCIYPRQQCPKAELEGGIRCSVVISPEGCRYTCPGRIEPEDDFEFTTPIEVTFHREDLAQRWTDELQRPGQTLSRFVDPQRRYLTANISDWKTKVPGSRVTHIEVLKSDNSVQRYAVADRKNLLIHSPEASCEAIRYRVVGERDYLESNADVQDGKVLFNPPERSAKFLSFNLTILQGGGPAILYSTKREKPVPSALRAPSNYVGLIQLVGNYRPANPRWSFLSWDLRIGGTIGQWGYYQGNVGHLPHRVDHKIAWVRLLPGIAAVVDLWKPMSVAMGIDVGSSWALRVLESKITSRFRIIVSPSLDARLAIRRWFSLIVQARLIWGEKLQRVTDSGVLDSYSALSVVGVYGLRAVF